MNPTEIRRILVVGASLSGLRMCEELRSAGYGGEIVLVGAEPHFPPYDRPPMSKGMLTKPGGAGDVRLSVSSELNALVRTNLKAKRLSADLHSVHFSDGSTVEFDALGVATGSSLQRISCPGADLPGVIHLRTAGDSRRLSARLRQGARVVVVGAGFIGCEIAASCRARGASVVMVDSLPWPMGRALGSAAGAAVTNLHRSHGVDVRLGVSVAAIHGRLAVECVQLTDGAEVPADVVVVGVGTRPTTDWLTDTSLVIHDGLVCEPDLSATGAPHIVGAGDVARWQHLGYGRQLRVEHWTNAIEQAEHAAGTLLARQADRTAYVGVPYFWSDQYDVKFQFVGVPAPEESVVEGSLDGDRAIVSYRDGGNLMGVLSVNWPARLVRYRLALTRKFEELMKLTELDDRSG
jgi:NADPH-dependent 2,4-dienoyl-CoA reductase/sulfur reductase-like enzyme